MESFIKTILDLINTYGVTLLMLGFFMWKFEQSEARLRDLIDKVTLSLDANTKAINNINRKLTSLEAMKIKIDSVENKLNELIKHMKAG